MATILKRKYSDGSIAYLAQVRVKPFKPTSKSFPKRKDAADWADKLERELRDQRTRGGVRMDVTKLTVAQLAREFLDDPETKALRYHSDLETLLAWWVNHYGGQRVLQMNVLTLREARGKLKPSRAAGTVNRYLSAFRSCWNWARAAGLIPQDLLWPSRLLLTEPKGRTRFLSDEELTRLLAEAAKASAVMHAAIIVSLACGVRQSELLRLEWADVDLTGKQSPSGPRMLVRESKNDEARAVHLPSVAVEALQTLKDASVVRTRVFVDDEGQLVDKDWIEYRWRPIREAARLHDFRWHDLRHSCASYLAQQGASLLEIGGVLGHKSPAATNRYSHLVAGAPVTGHAALNEKLRNRKPSG